MRTRVLLADDHKIVVEGLVKVVSQKNEVVGVASNGRELVDLAVELKPDLIVADISMPLLNGLDALRAIRKHGINSKVIFLTMHVDVALAVEAFRAGASGYVLKVAAGEELDRAIESAKRGRAYLGGSFPSDVLTVLAEAARQPRSEGAILTRRQREVMQLVAEGKSMKEVASVLGISTRTAESYKYELMRNLGLKSNAELVQYAIRIGLITVQPVST